MPKSISSVMIEMWLITSEFLCIVHTIFVFFN